MNTEEGGGLTRFEQRFQWPGGLRFRAWGSGHRRVPVVSDDPKSIVTTRGELDFIAARGGFLGALIIHDNKRYLEFLGSERR